MSGRASRRWPCRTALLGRARTAPRADLGWVRRLWRSEGRAERGGRGPRRRGFDLRTALERQVAVRIAERPSGLAVKSHRALQREALTELLLRQ